MPKTIEVLSLVNFINTRRIPYLDRSFTSFHHFNKNLRHIVIDGSPTMGDQFEFYKDLGIEYYHCPNQPYGQRLKFGSNLLKNDYFVFLPDDFTWIFHFPIAEAIQEAREHEIAELKLTCRGMNWFGTEGEQPQSWFEGARVMSGEVLRKEGNLFVSRRKFRNFHEQFSLACNIFNTRFLKTTISWLPNAVSTPGKVEKYAYIRLLPSWYAVAYYRMWIPAFHFIDLTVEGNGEVNLMKAKTSLIPENFEVYNRRFNR